MVLTQYFPLLHHLEVAAVVVEQVRLALLAKLVVLAVALEVLVQALATLQQQRPARVIRVVLLALVVAVVAALEQPVALVQRALAGLVCHRLSMAQQPTTLEAVVVALMAQQEALEVLAVVAEDVLMGRLHQ
jgi:hypothetical protein